MARSFVGNLVDRMPKDAPKKLGNPKLDNKRSYEDIPAPRNKIEEEENYQFEVTDKMVQYVELMNHFGIEVKSKDAWMDLAIALAEHYVPGMQMSKQRGQPQKWTPEAKLQLHALLELLKDKYPDKTRKVLFKLLPKEAQDTKLKTVIKPSTNPNTLEKEYDKFCNEKPLKALITNMKEHSKNDCLKAYKGLIQINT